METQYDEPKRQGGKFYRIRVANILDESWSDRLGGLSITQNEIEEIEASPETELFGWLPDQAALFGVLSTIYNNRLTLLSVECCD